MSRLLLSFPTRSGIHIVHIVVVCYLVAIGPYILEMCYLKYGHIQKKFEFTDLRGLKNQIQPDQKASYALRD